MPEDSPQTEALDRPRSAFGNRHAVLDRNGTSLRGFTTEDFHKSHWTPERREAQRQAMLKLHADGKAGGQNGFHRRRVKKAQEILAERMQERADDIWEALRAMIFDQQKDKRLQLEAIRELAKFEDWSVKNSREDEKEMRKLSGAELDTRLLSLMGDALGIDFTAFVEQLQQPAIDSTATDVEPCEACDEEANQLVERLRDSGVDDEQLIEITASRARCEDHRNGD